ncbi:hypothetical protein QOT17_024434 [Balamuthia mandrillaris]
MKSLTLLGVLLFVGALCLHSAVAIPPPGSNKEPSTPVYQELTIASSNNTKNGTGCASKTSCSSCAKEWDCVWCESSNTCIEGSIYGPKTKPFTTCKDWRWRQCKVNGMYLFWPITAGVVVILFLVATVCVCCCCRCHRRNKYAKLKTWEQIQAEEAELDGYRSKHPRTDQRRAELYSKYGSPEERNQRRSLFA